MVKYNQDKTKGDFTMNYNEIKKIIQGKQKGTFTNVEWTKELPLKKRYAGNVVKRGSQAVVRLGVKYDNMKSVQEKRATGELPPVNAGLPWGEWDDEYSITHKGKRYLRVSLAKNTDIKEVYSLNGKIVDKKEIEDMCLKSAFTTKKDVLNIDVDNIINIK